MYRISMKPGTTILIKILEQADVLVTVMELRRKNIIYTVSALNTADKVGSPLRAITLTGQAPASGWPGFRC